MTQQRSKPRIALDIDGVLADISYTFTRFAAERFNTRVVSGGAISGWNFEGVLTQRQKDWVWREVAASPRFWKQLPDLVGDGEKAMLRDFNVTYLTNRKDIGPTFQYTQDWLKERGYPQATHVALVGN